MSTEEQYSEDIKSSKFLLDILHREYDQVYSAIESLYNRVGISFGIIGVFLGWVLSNANDVSTLEEIESLSQFYKIALQDSGMAITIITGGIALILMVTVILLGKVSRLDVKRGFDEATMQLDELLVAQFLVPKYQDLVISARKVLEKKQKIYNVALILFLISLGIYLFLIIINVF
ncbi:MAG: hypothetical protein Q3980_11660 [Turicibacter sp.]|nr:hypothetical protein [Turicibacter sp.]